MTEKAFSFGPDIDFDEQTCQSTPIMDVGVSAVNPHVPRSFGLISSFGGDDDDVDDRLAAPLVVPGSSSSSLSAAAPAAAAVQPTTPPPTRPDPTKPAPPAPVSEVTPAVSPEEVSGLPKDLLGGLCVWQLDKHSKGSSVDDEFKYIFETDKRKRRVCKASNLPENVQKNRYLNVPCDDANRVILSSTGVPGSDYINASWIRDIEGDEEVKNVFIATQGPMTEYLKDFWRMVWETNANVIVFLGKEIEKGNRKVDRYWPDGDSEHSLKQLPWEKYRYDSFFPSYNRVEVHKKNMVLTPFTIEAINEEAIEGCQIVKRTFLLSNSKETREVYQFQYGGWPDNSAPKSSVDIRTLVNDVRAIHLKDEVPRPIIVHCSAGIGRTGAFCTIYIYVQNILRYMERMKTCGILDKVREESRRRAEELSSASSGRVSGFSVSGGGKTDLTSSAALRDRNVLSFNICRTVLSLRQCRIGMVQNPEQYKFCYKALVDEVREREFLPPVAEEPSDSVINKEALTSHSVIPVFPDRRIEEDVNRSNFGATSSLLCSSGFASMSIASQMRQLSSSPTKRSEKIRKPLPTDFSGNTFLSCAAAPQGAPGNPPLSASPNYAVHTTGLFFPGQRASPYDDNIDDDIRQGITRSPALPVRHVAQQTPASLPGDLAVPEDDEGCRLEAMHEHDHPKQWISGFH